MHSIALLGVAFHIPISTVAQSMEKHAWIGVHVPLEPVSSIAEPDTDGIVSFNQLTLLTCVLINLQQGRVGIWVGMVEPSYLIIVEKILGRRRSQLAQMLVQFFPLTNGGPHTHPMDHKKSQHNVGSVVVRANSQMRVDSHRRHHVIRPTLSQLCFNFCDKDCSASRTKHECYIDH